MVDIADLAALLGQLTGAKQTFGGGRGIDAPPSTNDPFSGEPVVVRNGVPLPRPRPPEANANPAPDSFADRFNALPPDTFAQRFGTFKGDRLDRPPPQPATFAERFDAAPLPAPLSLAPR